MPAGRSHPQLDRRARLPAAEAGTEQYPQWRRLISGQFAPDAAQPTEPHTVPGQLLSVAAVLAPRARQAAGQRQPRLPQSQLQHGPIEHAFLHGPFACTRPLGADIAKEYLHGQQPDCAEHDSFTTDYQKPLKLVSAVLFQHRGEWNSGWKNCYRGKSETPTLTRV